MIKRIIEITPTAIEKYSEINQLTDFKDVVSRVMNELGKRKIKDLFYKAFMYSPALVSCWKSGRKTPTTEQKKHFLTCALMAINLFDKSSKKNSDLLERFQSRVSVSEIQK